MSILTTAPPVAEPPQASTVQPQVDSSAPSEDQERQLLKAFRAMTAEQQQRFFRLVVAMFSLSRADRDGEDTAEREDELLARAREGGDDTIMRRYVENRRARRACGQPVEA